MKRLILLLLALTLLPRAVLVAVTHEAPRWDGYFYARLAEALVRGHGYAVLTPGRPPQPTAFYPVGYPAALAAGMSLVGDATVAMGLINLVAAFVTAMVLIVVTARTGGVRTVVRAGMLYALYPGAVLWCGAAMTETLHGTLLTLALAATVLPRTDRTRHGGAFAAGLALGAATLVRPQSLLLLPLAALGASSLRGRVIALLLATLGTVAVVSPWTARNCVCLDGCALVSTNGGSNLLIGTFPDAHGGYRRPQARDGCANVRGEVHRDRCMAALARERIRAAPARWLALGTLKLGGTFLWEHDPVSYLRGEGRQRFGDGTYCALVALCTAAWWALLLRAWHGLGRTHGDEGRTVTARFVVGACAVTALTHGVFLGADRYHLVLVPLLCVPASWAAPSDRKGLAEHPPRGCVTLDEGARRS
jgi:hypothetical protein